MEYTAINFYDRGTWEIYQYDRTVEIGKDMYTATKYQWPDGNLRIFRSEEACNREIEKLKHENSN